MLDNTQTTINNSCKYKIGDYIFYSKDLKTLSTTDFSLGRISSLILDEPLRVVVDALDNDLCKTGEEDIIADQNILSNHYENPPSGNFYGKTFKSPPKIIRDGENLIKIYAPKFILDTPDYDYTPILEALEKGFQAVYTVKSFLSDKSYNILIEEGETSKSVIKTAKDSFDYQMKLKITFTQPESASRAVVMCLAQLIWKNSSYENKNDWLQVFSEDFTYETLQSPQFVSKFFSFLKNSKDDKLSGEDTVIYKTLLKEIKKVKCLSCKELQIMLESCGEDYIQNHILPSVINGVRLKNSILVNPLTGSNPLKRFATELSTLLLMNKADSKYENCLRLFFD
jgi:hypothetical protein